MKEIEQLVFNIVGGVLCVFMIAYSSYYSNWLSLIISLFGLLLCQIVAMMRNVDLDDYIDEDEEEETDDEQ